MDAKSAEIRDRIMLNTDDTRTYIERLVPFAESYRADAGIRSRFDVEPHAVLVEHGVTVPPNVDVRVVENTRDVFHLTLPPDPHGALSDEDLNMVAGGKSVGSVGSVATASSASSVPSTASSAGSLGSASTAGSAET